MQGFIVENLLINDIECSFKCGIRSSHYYEYIFHGFVQPQRISPIERKQLFRTYDLHFLLSPWVRIEEHGLLPLKISLVKESKDYAG